MVPKLLAALLLISIPPVAAAAVPEEIMQQRAGQMVGFWNGEVEPEALYTPEFIARAENLGSDWKDEVEEFQIQFGTGELISIERTSPYSADIIVRYRSVPMKFRVEFDRQPPYLVASGRLVPVPD